ncbi:MAG: HPr family phosphocarrier protein [Oscillospiraceae bacterium]|nr:HPr family phosphocarrier protein [Oscillospiraceae bacterium]
MKEFTYKVKDELGIHARPAGLLVKEAAKFGCGIKITKGGKSADAKRLFALMGLAVKCGDEITVSCDGADEDAAVRELENFVSSNL